MQRRENGSYWLVDLGSRNGSYVNSRRVSTPVSLKHKDRLSFGDQEFEFQNAAGGTSPTGPATTSGPRNAPTTAIHLQSLTTILVADIRDYTRLARTLPESLLSQALGTWFLRVGQIAQSQGSWAQRYIGDAVMAVWVHEAGAHLETDLMRALRAINRIAAATGEIHQSLPLPAPLRIGAGVNTGNAIVGGSEYTALGDTVNAAFRLEAATKELGLGVALGERSFSALPESVRSLFVQRAATLKGYDGPTSVWAISFEDLAGL
jgi:adenylate cyclase